MLNARAGLPIDVTLARNDIAYRVNATGRIVDAPIVSNGAILTTPVVNNPWGGAFRSNRRPSVVAGVNPYLSKPGDKRVFLIRRLSRSRLPASTATWGGGRSRGRRWRSST